MAKEPGVRAFMFASMREELEAEERERQQLAQQRGGG